MSKILVYQGGGKPPPWWIIQTNKLIVGLDNLKF